MLAEVLLIALVYGVGILRVWRQYMALDTATWYATPSAEGAQLSLAGLLLLGFYLSPVYYDTSAIPKHLQMIYHLNPMVVLIDAYRDILLYGQIPGWLGLATLSMVSAGLLWISYRIFKRASVQFAEEL